MGIFVNDRAWNLKQAKENYDWEQWHLKRAQEATRKGDSSAARDHLSRAKSYHSKGDMNINAMPLNPQNSLV